MICKPCVLFRCRHNSARSQSAKGWRRHLAGDTFEVRSADIEPGQLAVSRPVRAWLLTTRQTPPTLS